MEHALNLIIPVRDDKLEPNDYQKSAIRAYLAKRPAVAVRFGRPVKPRSVRANAYYWGVVLTFIAEQTGHTTEEIHSWVKDEFLPRQFIAIGGKEKELRKTTTELSAQEFELYLEKIRAWAGQALGLAIPLPNEVFAS